MLQILKLATALKHGTLPLKEDEHTVEL